MSMGSGRLHKVDYKWIALSNTTLGVTMAALNSSIVLISLPAIFRGLNVNPLEPSESGCWRLLSCSCSPASRSAASTSASASTEEKTHALS